MNAPLKQPVRPGWIVDGGVLRRMTARERIAATPIVPKDPQGRKVYAPDGRVLAEYLRDRSHVSIIRGSIGSGTSSASIMKMFAISMEQHQGPDGLRRTRWIIVRNTFPDLKGTTVKTWLDWFPEDVYGRFYWDRPYRHILRLADMEMEVHFIALDSPDDIRKMRSMEVTGFWFNELEFIDKEIVDEAESRTGRYPAVKDGGARWDGVLADMNAPREDHWIPLMMGEVPLPESWTEDERLSFRRPKGWGYFVQPPSMLERRDGSGNLLGYDMNPEAENLLWLKDGYYEQKIQGKSKQWIDSRVLNKITVFVDGKPVWPMFNPETHVAGQEIHPIEGWPVVVGLDFGRNPAAVFAQIVNNRWLFFGELTAQDVGATTFAPLVKRFLDNRLGSWNTPGGYQVRFWGDPKGVDGVQTDEQTAYDIYRSFGMTVQPAPVKNNNINTRIEAVEYVLNGSVNGLQRLQICPVNCRALKVAMSGGYHYRRIKGTSRHEETPFKDRYSDIADATQYAVLGGGEGRSMQFGANAVTQGPVSYSVRKKTRRRGGF